jgi:hypothetical protein
MRALIRWRWGTGDQMRGWLETDFCSFDPQKNGRSPDERGPLELTFLPLYKD